MNFQPIEKIANAVLFEGFLLYPYRKSSVKNQQQWHFGTIGPAESGNPKMMQTECLVEVGPDTSVVCKIRFLQGRVERVLELDKLSPNQSPVRRPFSFPPIEGAVECEWLPMSFRTFRFTVRILNLTVGADTESAMLSTHTLLGVLNGKFVSLIDPPSEHAQNAADCRNIGTWPVLAGVDGERTFLLSSPIILYDYPQIAPESAGDFFDGTEIDEILTLRVLTLSDEEKAEIRAGTDSAIKILERTEALPTEAFAKMHGAIRTLRQRPQIAVRKGDRVRLHPSKKADIFDIALEGKIAIVESIERDFEDRIHVAVTVEDDPGRDLGVDRQIGHRFFLAPKKWNYYEGAGRGHRQHVPG